MAECYRCGKKIDMVVYCPYCGAKQRSSIEMYGMKDAEAKPEPPTIGEDEHYIDKPATPAEEAKPDTPAKPAEKEPQPTIPALPEAPKSKTYKIGKDFALWIIFIVVVIAFILAVIRFWQDLVMP